MFYHPRKPPESVSHLQEYTTHTATLPCRKSAILQNYNTCRSSPFLPHFLRDLTIITSKFVHALVEPLRSTSLFVLKYGALIHLVCSLVDRGVATIVSPAYSGIPGDVDDFFHFLVSDATRFLSSIPPIDYPGLVAFFVCIIYLICARAYELERKIERVYFYQNMCWRTLVSWLKLVYRAPTELTVGKFVRHRRQATSIATTVKILMDCQSKLRFLTDEVDKVYEAYTAINDTLSRLLQVESDYNSKVNQITRMLQASKSERQVLVKITESQGSRDFGCIYGNAQRKRG